MTDFSIEQLQAILAAKMAGEPLPIPKKVYDKKEVTITTHHSCVLCGNKWTSEDKYVGVGKKITRALKREMMHLTCGKCLGNMVTRAMIDQEHLVATLDHCIKIIQRSDRIVSDKYIYAETTCIYKCCDEDEEEEPITVEGVDYGYEI